MSETIVKFNDSRRLVHLEPTNITTVNGVPVTPDYTDFCIMFRLMADVVNRMDVIGVDGSSNNYEKIAITWISQVESGKGEKVYFTRGSKIGEGDATYLTTFYTDISYKDLSEKDVVEGLGVESIDVAIENFYAATVKIRFVDTRGVSLFAREEAIHSNTRLTDNDMYGCFFTMPYPKFTLQVKGYYGKAMTLQLTCTDFRGSFDSNTGNFIADVSFIGYDFSCLSDLPLRYVIISPLDGSIGRQYWEDNAKNNRNWQLYGPDGPEEPKMFIDVYKNIKNAVNSSGGFNADDYYELTEFTETNNEYTLISTIKSTYDSIFINNYDENMKGNYPFDTNTVFYSGFDESNFNTFTGKADLNITSYDNSLSGFNTPVQPDFEKLFSEIDEYNRASQYGGLEYDKDKFSYHESSFTEESGLYTKVFTFNDDGLYKQITERAGVLYEEVERISANLSKNETGKKIKDILGFTPYVGNVIKLLLCHVETFIHTVYETTSNIYNEMNNGQRSSDILGLKITDSDILRLHVLGIQRFGDEDVQIPPFPSIIVTDTSANTDDINHVFGFERNGWPGDFGDKCENWEEYKVIKGYFDASQRISSDDETKKNDKITEDMDDLLCAQYIFFKNLWDRWLVSNNINEFKVENMYDKFVFVDSFFRDISYKLHINADVLLSCLENKDGTNTVFSMLRSLANQHNCMFFSYGDPVSFTKGGSINNSAAKKNVEKMFTPIPYKDVENITTANKVVFMHHNKPAASTRMGIDGFSDDNMYFSDPNGLTEFANKAFESTRNGYVVPSFCVTYGKQANSFFTNFTINMDVPTATSQTAQSGYEIGKKYSASKRKVSFYGQDLFPVFSNFSYVCEFDMLGDMQITPLMYFELFNIPMFRGVYMIFSVKHSMKHGNMTTHVKGMRMSKESIPFSSKWFSDNYEETFRVTGITGGKFTYDKPEEILVTDVCDKYKSATKDEIVNFIIDLNGGYYNDSTEKIMNGANNYACYCSILQIETQNEISDDSTPQIKLWYELNIEINTQDSTITDGWKSDNEEIKGYVSEIYSGKYDDLGLNGVGDVLIQSLMLAHSSVSSNMSVCYEAYNRAFDKQITSVNGKINEDLKNGINSNNKKKYATALIQEMKMMYGKIQKSELNAYLLERVDNCVTKIKEKWCNDN